jgi:serralysin
MPTIVGTNGNDTLHGTTGADLIQGLDGNDLIIGHGGGDRIEGGAGDDVMVVFEHVDEVIEDAGAGFDTVYTYADHQLSPGSYVERLSAIDWRFTTPLQLIGNELANLIEGNAGDNFLDGGAGADTLYGFGGDDVYIVDDTGDVVIEFGDTGSALGRTRYGIDTVYTTVDYTLGAGSFVEILSVFDRAGTAPLRLIGNELDNIIEGNAGANYLFGGGGIDALYGFAGDDTYVVTTGGTRVFETGGNGFDTIYVYTGFTLAAGISVERISVYDWTTTMSVAIGGNELVNLIEGNAGVNQITGGGGADTMIGFGGNDEYLISDSGTIVVEAVGGGFDSVRTTVDYTLAPGMEIEQLLSLSPSVSLHLVGNEFGQFIMAFAGNDVLEGGGGNDTIWGNEGSDVMLGGDGNDLLEDRTSLAETDRLDGGLGADRMAGGGGADRFEFTTTLGSGNVDTIVDFLNGADVIALDDAIFTALAPGPLPASAFVVGSAATTADHRIIFTGGTSRELYYDPDGTGPAAAVHFATIENTSAVNASHFIVF